MTPSFKIAAAGLMLAALMGAVACSPEAQTAPGESAAPAAPVSPDVSAVRIGTLEATALRDGTLNVPAGNAEMSPWTNTAEVSALLTAAAILNDGVIGLPSRSQQSMT